jgi:pimeloyl-ACP methyl ester carboxylesterase
VDSLGVPALVLHGADDPIAPISVAVDVASRLPAAELAVARTSAHDVLNDAIHRTVAAHVVQWLERLRAGSPGSALLEVVRPAREPAGAA